MVLTFFPSFIDDVSQTRLGGWLLDTLLFPTSAAEQCPEAIFEWDESINIRQPYLAISAALGILVGVAGAIVFGSRAAADNGKMETTTKKTLAYPNECNIYLDIAYVTFGAMNICGLLIHCLWDAPNPTYPKSSPLLWALDCFFTGVSASSLGFASLTNLLEKRYEIKYLPYYYMLLQTIGLVILISFLWVDPSTTICLELWYLLPPIPAGILILADLAISYSSNENFDNGKTPFSTYVRCLQERLMEEKAVLIFVSGSMIALSGILLDAPFCSVVGADTFVLDLPTAGTLMFLGCDIAFLGLYLKWRSDGVGKKGIQGGGDCSTKNKKL